MGAVWVESDKINWSRHFKNDVKSHDSETSRHSVTERPCCRTYGELRRFSLSSKIARFISVLVITRE